MTDIPFEVWLRPLLDRIAEDLSGYTRQYQEGPPIEASQVHGALSTAWDGFQTIVRQDARYQLRSSLEHFLSEHDLSGKSEAERLIIYRAYIETFMHAKAEHRSPISEFIWRELAAEFDGTGDGSRIWELYVGLWSLVSIEEGSYYDEEEYEEGVEPPFKMLRRQYEVLLSALGEDALAKAGPIDIVEFVPYDWYEQ